MFEKVSNSECRMSRYGSFNPNEFNRLSCSNCYKLLVYVFTEFRMAYNVSSEGAFISEDQTILDPTLPSDVEIIRPTMDAIQFEKWRDCCKEAEKCCTQVMLNNKPLISSYNANSSKQAYCNSLWDGWSCHSATKAGATSKVKCLDHFIADTCNSIPGYAYLNCDESGNWHRNVYGEWTDYSSCTQSILPIKERLINVNIVCQSISLIFLLIGFIIFSSYRQLKVNRIKLHKNFFVSLMLNSVLQIVWESQIMKVSLLDPSHYIDSNHPGCIIINLLVQYTRSTNYFWMFSESLYLHKLIISVFEEPPNIYMYSFIGWGIPFILCSIYAILSLIWNNYSCWTRNIHLIYILNVPNILTILLNFLFLINIIRVLYKKLTAPNTNANGSTQYKKAVRATLILVPLFGLHLILSPYVMCDSSPGSQFHNLVNRLVESLQGLVVALIYCFFNGEVVTLIKKSLIELKIVKVVCLTNFNGNTEVDLDEFENPFVKIKRSLLRRGTTHEQINENIAPPPE